MNATLGRMRLQELLKQHGITTIRELTHRTGLSRQQCWNLWHGQAGVGKETLKRLHERLKIPLEALLEVDPVPRRKRPVKEPQQRHPRVAKKDKRHEQI
jgi:transcriptional regulator with XRE-family HTH domain